MQVSVARCLKVVSISVSLSGQAWLHPSCREQIQQCHGQMVEDGGQLRAAVLAQGYLVPQGKGRCRGRG